jgi:hypothetical protein
MPSQRTEVRLGTILLVCGFSLAMGGCGEKTVHAAPPTSAAPVSTAADRPMTTAPDTDATPPGVAVTPPPALPVAATAPPSQPVEIPPAKPAAPRKPAGEQASAPEPAAHPPAPQIAPQLSPSDQAAYEHATNDDISVAEKNLQQANGKQLSAAQQDLTEKIRSFLAQSRDASKGGDWARARNLAQKARLLSAELIESF